MTKKSLSLILVLTVLMTISVLGYNGCVFADRMPLSTALMPPIIPARVLPAPEPGLANIVNGPMDSEEAPDFITKESSATILAVTDGLYAFVATSSTGLDFAIDVKDGKITNGTRLQIWQSDLNNPNQKFYVTRQSDGSFTIKPLITPRVVDLAGGNANDGAMIQVYDPNNTSSQRWLIESCGGDKFTIKSKASAKVLDVSGGVFKNGTLIQQFSANNTISQKFKLVPVTEIPGVVANIMPLATVPVEQLKIDNSVDTKIKAFIADVNWKNGASWNGDRTPSISNWQSWGCAAYCADFVTYIYGNKQRPPYVGNTASILQTGDVVYFSAPHWFVILHRNDDGTLYTAEGNCLSKVRISSSVYKIVNGELLGNGTKKIILGVYRAQ